MKRAVILINPYIVSEHEFYQPRRMAEELAARGVHAEIVPNRGLCSVGREGIRESLTEKYDFCVYLDKDKYVPRMLQARGMRLFDRAEAVEVCDDKFLTHIALAGKVPMPKTVPAPLCYKKDAEAGDWDPGVGYPAVVKECFGSFGEQVYLAEDGAALSSLRGRLKMRPHLYQELIAESAGRDVRVIAIGGEAVACMKRVSDVDFRSNIGHGGRGEPFAQTEEVRRLASTVSSVLGLDYCGIDLLFGKEGFLVCEVNSNAFFGGIEEVTGVNVAGAYAAYICREIYGA